MSKKPVDRPSRHAGNASSGVGQGLDFLGYHFSPQGLSVASSGEASGNVRSGFTSKSREREFCIGRQMEVNIVIALGGVTARGGSLAPGFHLHWQWLCRGSGAGGPAMQGIAPRYS